MITAQGVKPNYSIHLLEDLESILNISNTQEIWQIKLELEHGLESEDSSDYVRLGNTCRFFKSASFSFINHN